MGYSTGNTIHTYTALSPFIGLIWVVWIIVVIIAFWRIFTKAGKHGWAAIIPFYNIYTLIKIAKKPGWWLILLFIPLLNVVISIIIALNIGKAFGRSLAFSILLLIIFPIGFLIIGFGGSKYVFATAQSQTQASPPLQAPPTQ